MKHIPRISETEWEIMRVVWAQHPITASAIVDTLAAADPSWHPKTARTLIARLVHKQALTCAPQGRAYAYLPAVTEQECVAAASESFLDRVFGGALQPMLAHFVGHRRLSAQELTALRRLLDEAQPPAPTEPRRRS